jgi:prepilin-type processing-associated H-X9-DG protein
MTRRLPRRGVSQIDVLIVVVLFLLLIPVVLVLLPLGHRDRVDCSNSVKCSSNLRQIGLALLLYSNENRGHYPRVTYVPGPDVTPVWGTGAESNDPFTGARPNDVSAAMFLLLRTQDITSEVFTCPSSNAVRDDFGGGTNSALDRANFTDIKKNLSYSLHNPYPSDGVIPVTDKTWWTNNMSAEFAVAADINPGNRGDKDDNVLRPNDSSSGAELKYANSDNHDRDGQNVLFGDGHVEFLSHPFAGIKRDNIYTTGNGKIVASPVDANDSVLLPTDD